VSETPGAGEARTGSGFGRVLVVVYGVFALAATARATVQIVRDFDAAPVAYSLSAFAALVYVVATVALAVGGVRAHRVATLAVLIELVGVLTVGTLSLLVPDAFPDATVWSGFGRGYGFVPLVLPLVGLWWLRRTRPVPQGVPGAVVRRADRTVVDPDRPVVGTRWRLDALVSGPGDDGTVSSIPQGVTSTLRITDQGRLELRPGCNTGMGSVEVAEGAGAVPSPGSTSHGTLTFGPIGLTMKACPPPQMEVEQAVTTVLQGEVRYEIAGGGMRLYATGGDPSGLVYVAED
jgi:heat shock protein HslJ